ncbi:hypothetical protein PR048_002434 [Dryococelus australis]|uniref:Uncharacterized protein n=1 Tax=Dryococelus australis TaxID=614101 RepID=A0ABQ9IK63_9NEOP|nr:hypothetical protein PR048_002434 [Dryococelus australis]
MNTYIRLARRSSESIYLPPPLPRAQLAKHVAARRLEARVRERHVGDRRRGRYTAAPTARQPGVRPLVYYHSEPVSIPGRLAPGRKRGELIVYLWVFSGQSHFFTIAFRCCSINSSCVKHAKCNSGELSMVVYAHLNGEHGLNESSEMYDVPKNYVWLTTTYIRKFAYDFAERNTIQQNYNNTMKMAGKKLCHVFTKRHPETLLLQPEYTSTVGDSVDCALVPDAKVGFGIGFAQLPYCDIAICYLGSH